MAFTEGSGACGFDREMFYTIACSAAGPTYYNVVKTPSKQATLHHKNAVCRLAVPPPRFCELHRACNHCNLSSSATAWSFFAISASHND